MKKLFFVLLCFVGQSILAQNSEKVDSLKKAYEMADHDSTRSLILSEWAYQYYSHNPDTSLKLAQEGLALAEKVNFDKGIMVCLRRIGLAYTQKGNYRISLEYGFRSLELARKMQDWEGVAAVSSNMGDIYRRLEINSLALNYYKQALENDQKSKNPLGIAISLRVIGILYEDNFQDYPSALNNYLQALKVFEELKDTTNIALVSVYIGGIYQKQAKMELALKYINRGTTLNEKLRNNRIFAYAFLNRAYIWFDLKNYQESIKNAEQALFYANKWQSQRTKQKVYELISKNYEKLRNYQKSLYFQQQYLQVKDSIDRDTKHHQILTLTAKMQLDEKDRQISSLEEKAETEKQIRKFYLIILTIGLLFFVFLILAYSFQRRINRQLKQQKWTIQIQSEEVKSSNEKLQITNAELQAILHNLKTTQTQLVQSEKMAGIGTLTAGIAHEINNPINFVKNNIANIEANLHDILEVVQAYEKITPENVDSKLLEIRTLKKKKEFEIAVEEMEELVYGIKEGANRTAEIVKSLRTFTRLDEQDRLISNLHDNIDSTLLLLQNQYKDRIEIVKNYGEIPPVECYIGKINQVFMNLLSNAMQAIEGNGTITITTEIETLEGVQDLTRFVKIRIRDTGGGIPPEVQGRIFDPFFTTKDVGKGTGLGLSISLDIAQKHKGNLTFESRVGKGTEFILTLPVEYVA